MRSIRRQLVVPLIAGVTVLQFVGGFGLFAYVEEAMEHSLDASLATKASAVAGAVHMEDDGRAHLQGAAADLSASVRHDSPFLFEIWRSDGTTLARSGPNPLAWPGKLQVFQHRRFADIRLADGSSARATLLSFKALPDEDEYDPPSTQPAPPAEQLTLVVAHDRRGIDELLTILLSGLLIETAIVIGGIGGIVAWSVRRGLRPLNDLADAVSKTGPQSLDQQYDPQRLPVEMQPVATKLNELLGRIDVAFQRERRFAADVAHELRTPLAELRTACEVALCWPDQQELREAIAEALAVSKQMDETVTTLLSLVRVQAGIDKPTMVRIEPASMASEIAAEVQDRALAKSLSWNVDLDHPTAVRSDARMLRQILRNLLDNAVQHTPPHGCVHLRQMSVGPCHALEITNTCTSLNESDLPHLREAFWRKDSARSDRTSTGLGLAIVDAYCQALDLELAFSLPRPDLFACRITFRKQFCLQSRPSDLVAASDSRG